VEKIMRPKNRFHFEEQLLKISAASITLSGEGGTGVEAMDSSIAIIVPPATG